MRRAVVVPARDEAARIGAALEALAGEVTPGRPLPVVVVLDRCTDATAAVVAEHRPGLEVHTAVGPGRGSGPARSLGLRVARRLLGDDPRALLLSTDADTRVEPGWLAAIERAADDGAQAIGGRILLDPREAAALGEAVCAAREHAAVTRLRRVRRWAPEAEHHQFSGASFALTVRAYDRVGGLPGVATLEDEALEQALRDHGIPIAYLDAVRVTTSARLDGRARLGLADALAAWTAELVA